MCPFKFENSVIFKIQVCRSKSKVLETHFRKDITSLILSLISIFWNRISPLNHVSLKHILRHDITSLYYIVNLWTIFWNMISPLNNVSLKHILKHDITSQSCVFEPYFETWYNLSIMYLWTIFRDMISPLN